MRETYVLYCGRKLGTQQPKAFLKFFKGIFWKSVQYSDQPDCRVEWASPDCCQDCLPHNRPVHDGGKDYGGDGDGDGALHRLSPLVQSSSLLPQSLSFVLLMKKLYDQFL